MRRGGRKRKTGGGGKIVGMITQASPHPPMQASKAVSSQKDTWIHRTLRLIFCEPIQEQKAKPHLKNHTAMPWYLSIVDLCSSPTACVPLASQDGFSPSLFLPLSSRRRGKEKSLGGREKGRLCECGGVYLCGWGREGGCLTDMRVEGGWACGRKFNKVLNEMGIDGTEMCHA